jgi:hypothetical protein
MRGWLKEYYQRSYELHSDVSTAMAVLDSVYRHCMHTRVHFLHNAD